jgi:formamidopyrimidine-DNA glycosylase
MPELPEVETIRRDLEKEVVGRKIKTVEVHGLRSIRRYTNKKTFIAKLEDRKIDGIGRRGKNLLISLGDDWLVVHLGMSGQLLRAVPKDPTVKHTHVVINFTQGGQLRYVDPRTFGELYVVSKAGLAEEAPELADLGFDPVEDAVSWDLFGARLIARRVKLKTLLMDQHFIAGIGNIYSDEILWNAGLKPDRGSETVSTQEVRRLYRSMGEVLQEAIKMRGSSLADEQYRDLFGKVGNYQNEHKVYGREGQPCRRCRHTVQRMKWTNRSSFFCPGCQV